MKLCPTNNLSPPFILFSVLFLSTPALAERMYYAGSLR